MSAPTLRTELQQTPKMTNLELYRELENSLGTRGKVALGSYMIGALSGRVDQEAWAEVLENAKYYILRTIGDE